MGIEADVLDEELFFLIKLFHFNINRFFSKIINNFYYFRACKNILITIY